MRKNKKIISFWNLLFFLSKNYLEIAKIFLNTANDTKSGILLRSGCPSVPDKYKDAVATENPEDYVKLKNFLNK